MMVFLPRVFLGRPFSPAPASLFLSPACPVWAGFVVSPTPLQQPAVSSEDRHCSLSTSVRFCNNTNKDLPVCFVFFFFKMGGGGGGVESQLLGCSIFKLLLFLFLLGTILQGSLALAIVAHSAGKCPSWITESSPAQGFILSHTSALSSPALPSAPY